MFTIRVPLADYIKARQPFENGMKLYCNLTTAERYTRITGTQLVGLSVNEKQVEDQCYKLDILVTDSNRNYTAMVNRIGVNGWYVDAQVQIVGAAVNSVTVAAN